MPEVEVGKFTLESLTTGMYTDPEIIFREYIQNSVDSLDNAVSEGVLNTTQCRIEMIIDADRGEIEIKDNGFGVPKAEAAKVLMDIGNSKKRSTSNRGFRGIGRLGGLSYCSRLVFCTSAIGDSQRTIVSFNCDKLRELLVPGKSEHYNLAQVLQEVTEIKYLPEQDSAHYFIVKMEGVDETTQLLELARMRDYIAQVAPLPYRSEFYRKSEIQGHLTQKGIVASEYPIFIGKSFESLKQVFKPNQITLKADRTREVQDTISSISFFEIRDVNELIAVGWYSDCNWFGTLVDERISGIRIRKGNILIGDGKTLAPFFKESRFSGWVQGEVFAVSHDLIPNARRDDFERNPKYETFVQGIRNTVGAEVSDKIRAASKLRNNPVTKILTEVTMGVIKVEGILQSGFFSAHDKDQVASDVDKTRKRLYQIPPSAPREVLEQKQELMTKLSEIATQVDESRNFKANTISCLI